MRIIALLLVVAVAGMATASCPPARGYAVTKAEPVVLAFYQFLPPVASAPPSAPPVPPAPDGPPVAVYAEEAVGPAARLLARHCAACHTQGSARGGVVLFDPHGTYQPNVTGAVSAVAVRADRMPLGARHDPAKRLVPQEKSVILSFLEGERP